MKFPDSSSTKTAAVPVSACVSRQETSHESDLGGCTARPGEGDLGFGRNGCRGGIAGAGSTGSMS